MTEHPLETLCARCDKRLRDHFFVDCCEDETPRPDTPRFLSRYRPGERNAEVHALRERLAAAEALSESRRVTLLAKSEELAAEWKRAETAEALVRELAAALRGARDAAQSHEWDTFRTNSDGYPISDERMCSTCGAFAQDGWDHENDCAFAKGLVDLSPAARKEIEG